MFTPHFTAFPTAFQFLPANAMLANKFCEQRAHWSAISQKNFSISVLLCAFQKRSNLYISFKKTFILITN